MHGRRRALRADAVDPLLDNPEMVLRQVGTNNPVLDLGPSGSELYGRGTGTYLDLPGDALAPGCIFADDSARYTPLSKSAVYAHVTTQANRPGYVAVQYWLYWYYNDWNDKHESDWEFVQVLFEADSVEAALDVDPVELGYAQHTGGETAEWNDDKLEKEGTHPVVYSSEGSHASYFEPALFLGRSASEGFGCDTTQDPSTRVVPKPILLPDQPAGPDDKFAWLAFDGRWGERHAGPNNGPDGPLGKPRWRSPVTWEENLRPSSFVIPGGSDTPPAVVGTSCNVVGRGSVLYVRYAAQPAAVLATLGVIALVLLFLLRRTSWAKLPPYPPAPACRRHGGARLDRAGTAGQPHPLRVVGGLELLADHRAADVRHRGHLMDDGRSRPSVGRAWEAMRAVGSRWRQLASAYLPAAMAIVLLSWTGIGLPVAAWLTVRFQFWARS